MANRQEIEETYNFMDEVIRVSFGEYADVTCALYNGDFSKTLAQAQRDKHDYILKAIHFKEGARVLDIGSGWGPMLKAVEKRGGYAIGLTLSTKQVLALHYVEINAEASRKGRTMTIESAKTTDRATQMTLSLLQDLFGSAQRHNFAVRLWDGSTWKLEPGNKEPPRFTLVLQHPGALRSMFLPPNELNLFEAYIYNDFDIEGDIESLFAMLDQLIDERGRVSKLEQLRYGKRLKSLPKTGQPHPIDLAVKLHGTRHSKERDRQAVNYHYEQYKQSNDFFALWLDRYMLYTCAYFATPNDDLDTAQERKLDYICRKLRLRPGERLLDIGCGWGGLVIYAAQNYGVEVHGITLGHHQAEFVQRRIQEAGLTERCRVEVCDYRDINEADRLDKIVSVGMFELVGEAQLLTYFKQAWHLLRPGGIFLNHAIASPSTTIAPDESNFFGRYVFPDGELIPISLTLRAAEMSGFEVRDVENLREHYPLTLRHWVRRLEAHADEARKLTSDAAYRIWRLYMAAFAHGFEIDRITIYQTLLAKPDQGDSGLPLTRADWYACPVPEK